VLAFGFEKPRQLWCHITNAMKQYMQASSSACVKTVSERQECMIGWKPPLMGWVKINFDGASQGCEQAGCGGLVRGDTGEWL